MKNSLLLQAFVPYNNINSCLSCKKILQLCSWCRIDLVAQTLNSVSKMFTDITFWIKHHFLEEIQFCVYVCIALLLPARIHTHPWFTLAPGISDIPCKTATSIYTKTEKDRFCFYFQRKRQRLVSAERYAWLSGTRWIRALAGRTSQWVSAHELGVMWT